MFTSLCATLFGAVGVASGFDLPPVGGAGACFRAQGDLSTGELRSKRTWCNGPYFPVAFTTFFKPSVC